jgi:hypothetical protein
VILALLIGLAATAVARWRQASTAEGRR